MSKLLNRLSCFLRHPFSAFSVKRLVVSIVIALLLASFDYIFSCRSKTSLLGGSDILAPAAFLFDKRGLDPELQCVNMALDKELVAVTDVAGDTLGCAAITDRSALLRFLDLAATTPYRFIMLDIRFEEGYRSDSDTALFARLREMPRLVLATHSTRTGFCIADTSLLPRAGMADYHTTAWGGFTRYEFMQEEGPSMALKMFEELDGGEINRHVLGCTDGHGRLCYNSQFLAIPPRAIDPLNDDWEPAFPYLGSYLMKQFTTDELRERLADKIILIGDFDEDVHSTFIGNVPGPLIHYIAYTQLRDGVNTVKIRTVLFIFVLFTAISYVLLGPREMKKQNKSPLAWRILLSLLSWSFFLYAAKFILYFTLHIYFSVSLPTFVFTFMSKYKFIKIK